MIPIRVMTNGIQSHPSLDLILRLVEDLRSSIKDVREAVDRYAPRRGEIRTQPLPVELQIRVEQLSIDENGVPNAAAATTIPTSTSTRKFVQEIGQISIRRQRYDFLRSGVPRPHLAAPATRAGGDLLRRAGALPLRHRHLRRTPRQGQVQAAGRLHRVLVARRALVLHRRRRGAVRPNPCRLVRWRRAPPDHPHETHLRRRPRGHPQGSDRLHRARLRRRHKFRLLFPHHRLRRLRFGPLQACEGARPKPVLLRQQEDGQHPPHRDLRPRRPPRPHLRRLHRRQPEPLRHLHGIPVAQPKTQLAASCQAGGQGTCHVQGEDQGGLSCAKLQRWEDMSASRKGICTVLATSNVIPNPARDMDVTLLAVPSSTSMAHVRCLRKCIQLEIDVVTDVAANNFKSKTSIDFSVHISEHTQAAPVHLTTLVFPSATNAGAPAIRLPKSRISVVTISADFLVSELSTIPTLLPDVLTFSLTPSRLMHQVYANCTRQEFDEIPCSDVIFSGYGFSSSAPTTVFAAALFSPTTTKAFHGWSVLEQLVLDADCAQVCRKNQLSTIISAEETCDALFDKAKRMESLNTKAWVLVLLDSRREYLKLQQLIVQFALEGSQFLYESYMQWDPGILKVSNQIVGSKHKDFT